MCQVKRRLFLGLSATILGGGLIAGKAGYGLVNGSQDAARSVHHHAFQFSDDERMNWQFISKERKGLALGELSQTGYIKAVTIMSLERPSLTRPRQKIL